MNQRKSQNKKYLLLLLLLLFLGGQAIYLWSGKKKVEAENKALSVQLVESEDRTKIVIADKNVVINGKDIEIEGLNHTIKRLRLDSTSMQQEIDALKQDQQYGNTQDASIADYKSIIAAKNRKIAELQKEQKRLKEKWKTINKQLEGTQKTNEQKEELVNSYLTELNELKEEIIQLRNTNPTDDLVAKGQNTTNPEVENEDESGDKQEEMAEFAEDDGEEDEGDAGNAYDTVLMIDDLHMQSKRIKENGIPVDNKYARSVSFIEVCFTAIRNPLINQHEQVFYLRLIANGDLIKTVESRTDTFTDKQTGESEYYTRRISIDYKKQKEQFCTDLYLDEGEKFVSGTHTVEFYQNGYLVGDIVRSLH